MAAEHKKTQGSRNIIDSCKQANKQVDMSLFAKRKDDVEGGIVHSQKGGQMSGKN